MLQPMMNFSLCFDKTALLRDLVHQHVGRLILGVDGMKRYLTSVHKVPEVMVLYVDVLGSWSHLGNLGNFQCTTVVLKDSAVYSWFG